jgi:hypothetical protein
MLLFWRKKERTTPPSAPRDIGQSARVTISKEPATTTTGSSDAAVTIVKVGKRQRPRVHDYMVQGSR